MLRTLLVLVSLLAATGASLAAQARQGWDARGLQLTRVELEETMARLDETAASSAYSGALREQARAEASLIRRRLDEGDIRVGDRIMLSVEGQPQLTEAFGVVAGRVIILPQIGEVPLEGVLRSELQQHMTAQIGRYIRDPVVHARSLIRLQVMGAVRNPGFFTIPSDLLLSDAIMVAGGPSTNRPELRIRIERGRDIIWDGERIEAALIEGRTLDQLSVQAGDGIFVRGPSGTRMGTVRNVLSIVSGVGSLIYIGMRIGLF
jgi:protein involved in polysaccharide export with SLBB domain